MEKQAYIFIILLNLFSAPFYAQTTDPIYQSFIMGEMGNWQKEIDKQQALPIKANELKLKLVNNQIGYIGWCVGMEKYDEAKKYIELADENLKELAALSYKTSYVKTYSGSIDGLKIGINNYKAIFLGPGVIRKAKSAMKLNKKNPNSYILLGNSKYYMWAMMGGSKEEALHYYMQAEQVMESESLTRESWNYLSLLTVIAHANVEMGKYDQADEYYKKILSIEPNYKWIKEEIYPQFITKYGK